MSGVIRHADEVNLAAIGIAALTFGLTRVLLKVSKFIPAPLIALGVATVLSATVLAGAGLTIIRDKYGPIPTNLFKFTPPTALDLTPAMVGDLAYFIVAIVFVSAVESLL